MSTTEEFEGQILAVCPLCNKEIDRLNVREVKVEWCDYFGDDNYDNFDYALTAPEEKTEYFCPECDRILILDEEHDVEDWIAGHQPNSKPNIQKKKIKHPLLSNN